MLDPLALGQIETALGESCTQGTASKKAASVREFVRFCRKRHIPKEHVFPSSQSLLCAFAASYFGKLAGGTVRGKISAVKVYHEQRELPWAGGEKLRRVLKGVENATPASSIRAQRPPVTTDMLRLLHKKLDQSVGLDAAVLAVANMSFYGQLRLGEVLPRVESLEKFDGTLQPVMLNLSEPFSAAGSRTIHLPWSKTKKARGEDVVITRQKGRTDPIAALENHMRTNKLSSRHPIASFRDAQGKVKALTKQRFLRRCNSIWKRYKIRRFTGHSFRIGGTTHYLLVGVNPEVVKTFGRWSSNAFLRYWRSLDALASRHIEMLKNKYEFA